MVRLSIFLERIKARIFSEKFDPTPILIAHFPSPQPTTRLFPSLEEQKASLYETRKEIIRIAWKGIK